MAVLQGALGLVAEAAPSLPAAEASSYRTEVERAIRNELDVDQQYTNLSRRLLDQASRAAQRADGPAIERIVARVPQEDRSWDRSARRWWRR